LGEIDYRYLLTTAVHHAHLCKYTDKKIQDLLQLLRTGPAISLCSRAPIFHRLFFQWTHKPPSFVHVLKPK
jgi:hypothetical protein